MSCQLFDRSITFGHVVDFLSIAYDAKRSHLICVIEIMRYEHAGYVLGTQLLDVVYADLD
jgi:hypothetical protein